MGLQCPDNGEIDKNCTKKANHIQIPLLLCHSKEAAGHVRHLHNHHREYPTKNLEFSRPQTICMTVTTKSVRTGQESIRNLLV
jgi:hypothetical protein